MTKQVDQFSIAIIPDTQMLACNHPDIYQTMAAWVKENAVPLNLQMVLHLGDVVHHGADDEAQFQAARVAFDELHHANIPLLITPGNHDYDNMLHRDRSLKMFNRYFGAHRYEHHPWFGGTFEEGQIENSYVKLNIGEEKYLFLSLEFGARDRVLAWADEVLEANLDHKAIIITHSYMYMFGERTKPGDAHNPKIYPGCETDVNDGEDMWHKSFKKHRNLLAIFSGHHIDTNTVSYRVDLGDNGNPIFQSFQNWQFVDKGGEGRLRILRMDPSANKMKLLTVNPCTGNYEKESGYEVDIPLHDEASTGTIRFP